MSEVAIGNLLGLALRLCKVSEDAGGKIGKNPLEVARICAQQGRKEIALLLLHIPLTHNLMTSAGLVLANPWENVLDVCVLRKSELEGVNLQLQEFKSFTIDASFSRKEDEEEGQEGVRSESYYTAVLDVLDTRTKTRSRKAFVYYLAPLSGSYIQFNVFIILDTQWIENVVKTLCQS